MAAVLPDCVRAVTSLSPLFSGCASRVRPALSFWL